LNGETAGPIGTVSEKLPEIADFGIVKSYLFIKKRYKKQTY